MSGAYPVRHGALPRGSRCRHGESQVRSSVETAPAVDVDDVDSCVDVIDAVDDAVAAAAGRSQAGDLSAQRVTRWGFSARGPKMNSRQAAPIFSGNRRRSGSMLAEIVLHRAKSPDCEPGTQFLIIGDSADFEVCESLGDGFSCAGRGKDVYRLFQFGQVITRDQHGGRATVYREVTSTSAPASRSGIHQKNSEK
jgi:hypothetical protein